MLYAFPHFTPSSRTKAATSRTEGTAEGFAVAPSAPRWRSYAPHAICTHSKLPFRPNSYDDMLILHTYISQKQKHMNSITLFTYIHTHTCTRMLSKSVHSIYVSNYFILFFLSSQPICTITPVRVRVIEPTKTRSNWTLNFRKSMCAMHI